MRLNKPLLRKKRMESDQLDKHIRECAFQHGSYFVFYLDRRWYLFKPSVRRTNRLTGNKRLVAVDSYVLFNSAIKRIREEEDGRIEPKTDGKTPS